MGRHTRQSSAQQQMPQSLRASPTNNVWSSQDDDRLRAAMTIQNDEHLDLNAIIQRNFPDGSHTTEECLARWDQLRQQQTIKGPWSQSEDARLKDLIAEHGPERWASIAVSMRTRTGKQCRERWHNHLDPKILKIPFTPEENALIFDLYTRYGSSWAVIAKHLPGRPDNAIKNHFNTSLQRSKKKNSSSGPTPGAISATNPPSVITPSKAKSPKAGSLSINTALEAPLSTGMTQPIRAGPSTQMHPSPGIAPLAKSISNTPRYSPYGRARTLSNASSRASRPSSPSPLSPHGSISRSTSPVDARISLRRSAQRMGSLSRNLDKEFFNSLQNRNGFEPSGAMTAPIGGESDPFLNWSSSTPADESTSTSLYQAAGSSPMRRARTTSNQPSYPPSSSENVFPPFPSFYTHSNFGSAAMSTSQSSPGEFRVPQSTSSNSLPALSTSSSDSSVSTSPEFDFSMSGRPEDFSPASAVPSSHFLQRSGSMPALFSTNPTMQPYHSPTYDGLQSSYQMHHRSSLPLACEQNNNFAGLNLDQDYFADLSSPQKHRDPRFYQYRNEFNKFTPPQTPESALSMSTASYTSSNGQQLTPTTMFSPKMAMSASQGSIRFSNGRSMHDQMGYSSPASTGFDSASRALSNALPLAQPVPINPMHHFDHLRQESAAEEETLYYAGPIGSAQESLQSIPEHCYMPGGMVTDAELLEVSYDAFFQDPSRDSGLPFGHYSADGGIFQ